ncbi:MAG TPA: autotransporter assembly complex family protein, partial [Dissulfurispiraceae bacterium]
AKQDLQATAMDEGFLDAQFPLHRITVHLREYYATIDLHLDTGPLYRFGEVSFRQDILRPEFLGRFVPFQKGDPYRTSKLLELQDALTASDYFRQVEVKPRRDLARDLTIPVEVDLTPQKRQRYTFGLGYGTDTGFRGVLGWEDRWVNRKGHRFSTELRLSQIQRNFSARYIIPMKKPATDHLDFTAGLFHESTNIYTTETRMIGTSRSILRGSWQQTFYLNLQKEKFTIDDESGKSTLLLPGTGWTRIKADNRVFTTRGSRLVLDVRGADKMLLSSTSLIQFRSNLKFIRSPWDTGRIILRGDFGVTWVGDFPKLPASLRFFAGGDQSVRGYGHKTLGPMNAKGKVIGGRHLVVGSFEYDQRIYKKWGAAVFYDVGNALNKLSDPLKHGAGIGLRWRSPVGMVRLDFARALSERNRWHIHINIGPDL